MSPDPRPVLARLAMLAWSAMVTGCAITPQPIFGSALAPGQVGLGPIWGSSYGPSTARIIGSDGAVHEIRGNGDSVLGLSPLNLGLAIPLAGVARAAVGPRVEVGAHAGWYGAGGGARLRLTDPEAGQATYLTADSQAGYAIPHDDRTRQLRRPLAGRFLVETSVAVGRRWHVLGAIGISAGYRRHGVDAGTFMRSTSIDRPFGAENTLAVERSELRLEGAIGGHLTFFRFLGIQAMLVPYVVLAHGTPTSECLNCSGSATLESFSQQWGLTILVNPLAVLGPRRSSPN